MKASELISRARSLADIPNSDFISYADQLESLNESYRDIYSVLVENDDDYYLEEITIALTAGMLSEEGVYIVPLPTDFYKLRFVDRRAGSTWEPMDKFNLKIKDWTGQTASYRLRENNLWIVGNIEKGTTVRIGYYPPPVRVTAPNKTIAFASAVTAPNKRLITYPAYAADTRCMYYVYNGVIIYEENDIAKTRTALGTLATTTTGLAYRNGYLFWIRAADLWSAPATVAGVAAPVNLTGTANIVSFSIVDNTLYYYNGTDTKQANLDGSSVSNYVAGAQVTSVSKYGTGLARLTAANHVVINGTDINAWFAPAITSMTADGTYLYYTEANVLTRATLDLTAQTYTTDALASNALASYVTTGGYIPLVDMEGDLAAVSTAVDMDFTYPLNEVNELMAYQSAIDFRRKQRGDATDLKERRAQLFDRFLDVVKRDEYRPERIQNYYTRSSANAW